ncbi:DUF5134 domain-containing protein [Streptomyces sp. Ru87]|uniref:DUF5134 domain-containing protein n=1 Tax=Streptomyces sp. Ru87 TaxID=2044307 RepID=UPI000BF389E1|nr:DUF5134 domain-containing protein [Streptomyces sp. Ru87]PGH51854.1 DUF5134 domain-containing protein [Streptomyces sp. Ru87]
MHGSPLAGWLLVAVCGASAGYCLLRMPYCAPGPRRMAAGEALMGTGMAAMAVPVAAVAGLPWLPWLLAGVFAGSLVLAASCLLSGPADRHHLHHAVGAAAMVYMALSAPAGHAAGHAAHGSGGRAGVIPVLAGLLLVYFAGYVLAAGARLVPPPATAPGSAATGGSRSAVTRRWPPATGGPDGVRPHRAGPHRTAPDRKHAAGDLAGRSGRTRAWAQAPELVTACRVAMGIGMLVMLPAL